jgi:hypothetical protein
MSKAADEFSYQQEYWENTCKTIFVRCFLWILNENFIWTDIHMSC